MSNIYYVCDKCKVSWNIDLIKDGLCPGCKKAKNPTEVSIERIDCSPIYFYFTLEQLAIFNEAIKDKMGDDNITMTARTEDVLIELIKDAQKYKRMKMFWDSLEYLREGVSKQ